MDPKFPTTITLRKTHADSDTGESTYDVLMVGGKPVAEVMAQAVAVADQVRGRMGAADDQDPASLRAFEAGQRQRADWQREDLERKLQILRQLRADGAVEVEICDHGGLKVRWPEPSAARSAKGSDPDHTG